MLNFIQYLIIIVTLTAFILLTAKKMGAIDYVQRNTGNDFVYRLFTCQLCLSFWGCLLVSIIGFMITGDFIFLLIPFCATPLTLKLLW